MEMDLSESFWTERYKSGRTGWDIGYASTPIKEYIDQLDDKTINILIPGAGNAYEAEYLFSNGFKNVTVLDISQFPLDQLKMKVPVEFHDNLRNEDFFAHEGGYDLILEQTFFSAIEPKLRHKYALKMLDLLKPGGRLVGVLFNIPLYTDHPPFGGNREEYLGYFNGRFELEHFETCYNSIPPRQGNELFISLKKPEK